MGLALNSPKTLLLWKKKAEPRRKTHSPRAAELAAFLDAAERLKRQEPDPETGVIEQFDGYFKLENVLVPQVRSRLLDPGNTGAARMAWQRRRRSSSRRM